ncbi:DUF2291 family protein [Glaciimonas sp. GG7]
MNKRIACALTVLVISSLLGGCKLVKNSDKTASDTSSFNSSAFDPVRMADQLWTPQILPYINKKAVDFTILQAAIEKDLDAAGAQYGYREKGEDAAWNFVTTVEGTVVDVDTEASAPALQVATQSDGKADVEIQLGPIFSGASLRDALDFISFTKFANQIDFARFASALNDHAYAIALKDKVPADIKGKKIKVTATFTYDSSAEMPSLMPVSFSVEAAK